MSVVWKTVVLLTAAAAVLPAQVARVGPSPARAGNSGPAAPPAIEKVTGAVTPRCAPGSVARTDRQLAAPKCARPTIPDSLRDWTIVKGVAASSMDSLAATELKRYVEQMTGETVPVVTDAQQPGTRNVFLVGKRGTNTLIASLAARGLIHISDTFPGTEGFINKTVDDAGRHYAVLAGCDELGAQYAVYDFLESYCHVGFLLDGDNVPFLDTLVVTGLDAEKKPFCRYRQQSAMGKCKLWYGGGTWTGLFRLDSAGYSTGWRDYIDWMLRKKQNVLYLKRGCFNFGYVAGFPELQNPADSASIAADGSWFNLPFALALTHAVVNYARWRGMKLCYTATICRFPSCFTEQINDPTHPCYGLRYENFGSWIRLDPLDNRSYSYCLKGQVQAIVRELGAPDFWYGYYAWSEGDTSMGLPFRSYCHHMAHDLVFDSTGGALLVYTWDWGNRIPLDTEWARYKSVMPRDGSVILEVNNSVIPGVFLNDPDGPFAMFPWSKYMTATTDDQCLPEQSSSIVGSWYTWHDVMTLCQLNLPLGFGLDNMIHHVDQRVTDFECNQGFAPDVLTRSFNDFLDGYSRRAYGDGPQFADMFELHKQWALHRAVTTAQVEQYMIPEWFRLRNSTIFRTDLTEALYYDANDYDKCALLYDKWIYSNQFTIDWADANIPSDVWVPSGRSLWSNGLRWPSDMTWENKSSYLSGILPGLLTIHVTDSLGNPVPDRDVFVRRGWLTRIPEQDTFTLRTNSQGDAQVSLMPDVYALTMPGARDSTAVLMLHGRDKAVTITLSPLATGEGREPGLTTALVGVGPNPFKGDALIRYSLASPMPVSVRVYGLAGRLMRTLVNRQEKPGRYAVRWDGTDARGSSLASGVYFCWFRAGEVNQMQKLILMSRE